MAPTSAPDRRRLCRIAIMVAQRTVADLQLESQIRSRRPRRPGHLRHGYCQPSDGSNSPTRPAATTFPRWAPDSRHIVFERTIGGQAQIWSMLADGTEQHQLTKSGRISCRTGVGSKKDRLHMVVNLRHLREFSSTSPCGQSARCQQTRASRACHFRSPRFCPCTPCRSPGRRPFRRPSHHLLDGNSV